MRTFVCVCVCVLFLFVRKGSFLFHSIWLYSRWLLNRWAPAIWNLRGQTSHDRRAVRVTSYLTLWSVHQRSPYNRSCRILYCNVWRHQIIWYIFLNIFSIFSFLYFICFYNIIFNRDTSQLSMAYDVILNLLLRFRFMLFSIQILQR